MSPSAQSQPVAHFSACLPGCLQARRWTEPSNCAALLQIIMDDRRIGGCDASQGDGSPKKRRKTLPRSQKRRGLLPPAVYSELVASFLRFEAPIPNMLYVIGGRSQRLGPLSTFEMLDTWHGRWVPCPPMPTRRAGSAAASLPDDKIIIVGGYDERGISEGLLGSCDVYDPHVQSWREGGAAPLATARWGHACASLGGRVYAVGGCSLPRGAQPRQGFMETLRSCEVYEPERDEWRPCAPLQVPRSGLKVVALQERYLVAVGGCDDVFGRAETLPTVELYDSHLGFWTVLETRLGHPRTSAGVVAIDNHRLVVVGGARSLESTEVYRVSLPSGERVGFDEAESEDVRAAEKSHELLVGDMLEGRMGCQAAVVNLPNKGQSFPLTGSRCVVVVGGERCNEEGSGPRVKQFKSIPAYDITTGVWREDRVVPPMSSPRTAVALCVGIGHVSVPS